MTPDGWQSATLGDDATVLSGQHILADECSESRIGLPYLTGPADFQDGIIRATKYVRSPKVVCEAGDILLTVKGSGTGKLVQADATYCISRQLAAIRPQAWWGRFVLHVLSSLQSRLQDSASGLIPGLSRDELLGLPVLLPPIGEQKKIAAILSSVDDAIEATQAVIDQLGVVKKAMMAELLTRGLPGRHKKFKMTEIGQVPDEWAVRTIDSVLESCTYGVNCPLSPDLASGTPVLRMTNIQGDRLDLSDLKYANLDALPRDKIELRRGDLLFNRTNSADLVGKVALVDTDAKLSYASYLLRMRTDHSVASTAWLFYRLSAPDLQEQLRSIATKGVSQSNINPTKMRALLIAVPRTAEQSEIVAALGSVDDRSAAERARAQQLRSLKTALMSVLLTGEVRVKPDEEAA